MALSKFIFTLALVGLLVSWLVFKNKPKLSTQPANYQNIPVQEFDNILASSDPFVVDVHVPEQNHIPNTDAFISYQQVESRLNEFPQDKNAEILLYCRSGSMSAQAAQVLSQAGYTNVKNLVGGINAWKEHHFNDQLMEKFN